MMTQPHIRTHMHTHAHTPYPHANTHTSLEFVTAKIKGEPHIQTYPHTLTCIDKRIYTHILTHSHAES